MVKIRNYNVKDSESLISLLKETRLYYPLLDKPEFFRKKIKKDKDSILVAEENEKVIGTVFIIYDAWNPFIFHLGVLPEYRSRGLGKKLMETAEKKIWKTGAKEITIFVTDDNKEVVDYYKKMNYKFLYRTYCLVKNP